MYSNHRETNKAQEEFMSLLKYDKFCQSLKAILKFSNTVGNGESYLGTCWPYAFALPHYMLDASVM